MTLLAVQLAAATASAADLVPLSLPVGTNVWTMFQQADVVVKVVMIGLIIASVLTWTIWLAKTFELYTARRRLRAGFVRMSQATTLHEALAANGLNDATARALLAAADDEWQRSEGLRDDRDGVKERIASHLDRIEAASGRRMTRGTGLLATIGSTAPFVGLFGTVWGIMNSFLGIAATHTTNLAVVAPGIAEALLATTCGLFAAIPAVVIYNYFARQVAGYRAQVGDTSALVLRLVSRELSREAISTHAREG